MTFETGSILITSGVNSEIGKSTAFSKFITNSFGRYLLGDWGDLLNDDKIMNDKAVENSDDRIVARYNYNGQGIYIITEWDRSATTILLTEEY